MAKPNHLRPVQQRGIVAANAKLTNMLAKNQRGEKLTTRDRLFLANVAPGTGKTWLALMIIELALRVGVAKNIIWLTPRTNLCKQLELITIEQTSALSQKSFPGEICHRQNKPPFLDTSRAVQIGYTITYASAVTRPELHEQEIARNDYVLVLDEAQQLGASNELGDGTLSAEVVEKFAESAKFVVMLTGTPYRSDNRELIFAEYTQQDEYGTRRLLADVEADYLEGVREGYLRPMEALVFDGTIQVEDLTAGRKDEATISENNVALGRIVRDKGCYQRLVDETIAKVRELQHAWPMYCGLIAAADQTHARAIQKYVSRQHPHIKTLLALSDDPASQTGLDDFKQGGYDILITCAMAHVGYDYPPISVVCVLSLVRDQGWLHQLVGRGMRVVNIPDPAVNEMQRVYIIAPDDPEMTNFLERLRSESEQGLSQRDNRVAAASTSSEDQPLHAPRLIDVTVANMDDPRAVGMESTQDLDPNKLAAIDKICAKAGFTGPRIMAAALLDEAAKQNSGNNQPELPQLTPTVRVMTSMERIAAMRSEIAKYARQADHYLGARWGTAHGAIKKYLGHEMSTEADCLSALEWVKSKWLPHCYAKHNRVRPSVKIHNA